MASVDACAYLLSVLARRVSEVCLGLFFLLFSPRKKKKILALFFVEMTTLLHGKNHRIVKQNSHQGICVLQWYLRITMLAYLF